MKEKKKRNKKIMIISVIVLLIAVLAAAAWFFNLFPAKKYSAEDFNIKAITSPTDKNNNGVDDFTDIVLGARKDAENKPRYDGSYHNGGYPPDNVGVCSDVIWRALGCAGYDLKSLIDGDIAANPGLYPGLDATGPDPGIDFRRVRNLRVFFSRHCPSLSLDIYDIEQWQPGDIVVFAKGDHIAVVSDIRNKDGVPWLI